jgi:hypothetical protein
MTNAPIIKFLKENSIPTATTHRESDVRVFINTLDSNMISKLVELGVKRITFIENHIRLGI